MKKILLECPVLVVPEIFNSPKKNILSYDGSESSVFAIKQFAYLFPEMAKNPSILVYANPEWNNEIPDKENIEELATRHYPDLIVKKLDLDPKKYFKDWLAGEKGAVLIAGSYGRSLFSRIFKKSFVSGIIKDHRLPVFIAHK